MTDSSPSTTAAAAAAAPIPSRLKRIGRWLGATGAFAIFSIAMPVVGAVVFLDSIREIAPWCQAHAHGIAPLIVTLGGVLVVGSFLLPTYFITVLAGWAFGFRVGLPVALAAYLGAAVLAFLLARWILGDRILQTARDHPRFNDVREFLARGGFWRTFVIIGLLRIAPVAPFGLTNVFAAAVGCRFVPYTLGSFCGIFPRTIAVVLMASRMEEFGFRQEPWIAGLSIVALFVILILVTLIGRHGLKRVVARS